MDSDGKTTTDPNLVQPGSWQEFIIKSGEACSIAAVILSIIFLLFDSLRTSYPVNVVIIILLVLLWTFGASAIYAQLPWKYLLMLLGPATTVMLIVIFLPVLLLPIIFWGLASIFAIIIIVQFCRYICFADEKYKSVTTSKLSYFTIT
uniref:Uncharacterized protein n=1 Tax=Trichobilharzia regenti TaxID=157069 RepID=A0AA85IU12_TRIRE|nr:unnamed protein product [Trichobilharzia regenti]